MPPLGHGPALGTRPTTSKRDQIVMAGPSSMRMPDHRRANPAFPRCPHPILHAHAVYAAPASGAFGHAHARARAIHSMLRALFCPVVVRPQLPAIAREVTGQSLVMKQPC